MTVHYKFLFVVKYISAVLPVADIILFYLISFLSIFFSVLYRLTMNDNCINNSLCNLIFKHLLFVGIAFEQVSFEHFGNVRICSMNCDQGSIVLENMVSTTFKDQEGQRSTTET